MSGLFLERFLLDLFRRMVQCLCTSVCPTSRDVERPTDQPSEPPIDRRTNRGSSLCAKEKETRLEVSCKAEDEVGGSARGTARYKNRPLPAPLAGTDICKTLLTLFFATSTTGYEFHIRVEHCQTRRNTASATKEKLFFLFSGKLQESTCSRIRFPRRLPCQCFRLLSYPRITSVALRRARENSA